MLARVSGLTAILYKGPLSVGSLHDWKMTRIEEGDYKGAFWFDSAIGDVDTFWQTRGPFTLRLDLGASPVTFRDVSLTLSGQRATGVIRAEQREKRV